ncbi:hypothetical protein [Tepidibacter thalassicus]|uniref:PilX N-terminal n=1 Tax=Tepidibacter thalassicus DSM 15285 TaxID=1123350 RepID=A0A1M5T662_9FIRM|nr:hypothetical protein [Tepidibacter thalassicus]SHH46214.1 hypothetical protein SAMN02744040_02042 [Tepidibacter thalassicus DSM 15285]
MLKVLLKNKKGSTLIMVLMSLSVLSILGTAIISLSVMNLKSKIVDKKIKTSFYLSEAGLEEAYAIMMNEVQEGIKKGNEEVEKELKDFIKKEKLKESEGDYNSPYLNSDGSVDEEAIKSKLEEWFRQGYARHLNNQLLKKIKDGDNYSELESSMNPSKPKIRIEEKKEFPQNPDEESKFEITLISNFTHDNIQKQIKSKFLISIPKYNKPYYIKSEKVNLKENVLWTKALISEKDILVKGNNVTINGDIYAYGNTIKDIKERGIAVKGKLTVNGNVFTDGYFQTKENGSSITVKNGDVYCKSLVIPDEQSGCNIMINGNVNTYDDIELNGKKSSITINGNYYGFSYGSEGHDKSSSIIINSDDIGAGSSITITGEGKGKKYYKEDGKGTFIAGTVYIDLDNEDYQTGESVSVKGNYRAYSEKLGESTFEFDGKEYGEDDIEFSYFSPLYLMNKIKEKTNRLYEQRGKYLKAIYDKNNSIINLGNGAIDIRNVKYSLGDYIEKGNGIDKLKVGSFNHLDYTTVFDQNLKEYKYYVNRMGDPQIEDYSNYTDIDEKLTIEDRFDFKDIKPSSNNMILKKDEELFFSNSDADKSISIIGINSQNSITGTYNVELKDTNLKGIIITKGDVYISGEINFEGVIIAGGNIYIQDDNPKIFTNKYSGNLANNYVIKKVCEHKEKDGIQIGDLFKDIGDKEIDVVYNAEIGVNDDVKTYYRFSDLIKIKEWKKIK